MPGLPTHLVQELNVGTVYNTFICCEKVGSDLVIGGRFAGYSGFRHQLQLASHDLAAIGQIDGQKTKFQVPNSMYNTSLSEVTFSSELNSRRSSTIIQKLKAV